MQYNSPIFNYFQELNLTKDQENALLKIEEFLKNDTQIFILKGYAGTGKTTLLKGLTKYLIKAHRLGHIMAPTGRAAKVIQNITNYQATTIHKFLYDLENLKTYKYTDKDGNKTFKFYFDFPIDPNEIERVFIFDEASMISNMFSEGEFFRFGSGFLLNDILNFFDLNSNKNTKLIFVGDPAQIPPVGSNESLALTETFFDKKNFTYLSTELKKVIRQSKESGILKNAQYYRDLIFSEKVSENVLDTSSEDVEEIAVQNLIDQYTEYAPLPNSKKCMIITYSNRLALTYNQIVREQYFPDEKNIVADDILQIVKNNYTNGQTELLNGDFVKVLSINKETEAQSARIKKKNSNDRVIRHIFRKIKILTYTGITVEIMLLDSFLNSKKRDLSSDETKALYINFIMRYEKSIGGRANKKSKEFKEAFKNDPYYNALQAKYGYAITGHKSQGGEWNHVFVDFTGRIGVHKDALRWIYTAITRASKKLFVLHPPKLKQVDFSKIKNIVIGKIKKVPKGTMVYPKIDNTPYHTEHSHPAKKLNYLEVKNILDKIGGSIVSVNSKDYLEKYLINTGKIIFTIDMYHDAEGIFTKYSSTNKESSQVIQLLSKVRPWEFEYTYNTNSKLLNSIYQNVLSAMQGLDIQLIKIDDDKKIDFHIDYYFRTQAQIAYLQIYFNKNEVVTNIIAKSMLGEDDALLRKLIDNLKNSS